MRRQNFKTVSIGIQIILWILVLLFTPLTHLLQTNDFNAFVHSIPFAAMVMVPAVIIFYANYLLFVPKFLIDKHRLLFWIGNFLLFAVIVGFRSYRTHKMMPPMPPLPPEFHFSRFRIYAVSGLYMLGLHVVLSLLAIGARYMERYNALKDANLSWLKSQLNPHFLFNTLNNISSLTQIDPDKAQDSIAELSDLLRYTLYETEEQLVPLEGEVGFLNNYIDLMSLRYSDSAEIERDFQVPSGNVLVAPLLYMTLVENAFKHGLSSNKDSFIRVSLSSREKDLVFKCENSLFEKTGVDRAGSGIGIENLKRRLELIYPGKYEYLTEASEGKYCATIILKGIC
ncbi:MAG: histidine kinase [Bacteroidales bacterium]|nr:histidine kinase [Bacteroidales bacterium]